MAELIRLENIRKSYGENEVLKNITISIQEKEFVTLLGPSGCGKTTTLRILGGFENPDSGRILFDGKDITNVPSNRRNLNTVFQNYALFPHMTVGDNVAFGLQVKGMNESDVKEKVHYGLKLVNLEGYENRKISQMSGGQQQRVAMARAIVNEPKVLLLDEPLGALDLKLRQEMQYELVRLKHELGITFIYVTHDQEEALAMSDWIFVMNEGEIVQSGTPVDIYDEPINHFVATFIGESNILPGIMIEDYLVEFNGKRFESVDGGMRPNEPVEVVIRPEDLRITLPEEGKLQVKVDTQLFRGVHYEIIAYDELGNEWMIHSTRKAIVGEEIGLDFEPEDIHVMRLNETEEEFDARIEEYVEVEEQEAGLINAIEEERDEENNL